MAEDLPGNKTELAYEFAYPDGNPAFTVVRVTNGKMTQYQYTVHNGPAQRILDVYTELLIENIRRMDKIREEFGLVLNDGEAV